MRLCDHFGPPILNLRNANQQFVNITGVNKNAHRHHENLRVLIGPPVYTYLILFKLLREK